MPAGSSSAAATSPVSRRTSGTSTRCSSPTGCSGTSTSPGTSRSACAAVRCRAVAAIGVLLSCIAALWAVYTYRAGHRRTDIIEHSDATDSGVAESAGGPTAESGKYLVEAGNCVSCRTRAGAAAFSGGVPFETPFGRIYSTNIIPDLATGIGKWSLSDLVRAMHEGVAVGGRRLFPAFPYPSFTKVSDQDVRAIYAHLRTLKPIRYAPPSNDFLLTQRWSLISPWRIFILQQRGRMDHRSFR